jgi:uncharacterized protein
MDAFEPSDLVEIRRDARKGFGGRGVFARRRISEGTIIERAPVLLVPRDQVFENSPVPLPSRRLSWYVYEWGEHQGQECVAVALGYGSLYNHSYQPNAIYRMEDPDAIEFIALRHIEPNEEITLNYNGQPDDDSPVMFYPMPYPPKV